MTITGPGFTAAPFVAMTARVEPREMTRAAAIRSFERRARRAWGARVFVTTTQVSSANSVEVEVLERPTKAQERRGINASSIVARGVLHWRLA
jgi:hypothetical protein